MLSTTQPPLPNLSTKIGPRTEDPRLSEYSLYSVWLVSRLRSVSSFPLIPSPVRRTSTPRLDPKLLTTTDSHDHFLLWSQNWIITITVSTRLDDPNLVHQVYIHLSSSGRQGQETIHQLNPQCSTVNVRSLTYLRIPPLSPPFKGHPRSRIPRFPPSVGPRRLRHRTHPCASRVTSRRNDRSADN